jgi:DNA-binding NarL/FixJ family response regulator
MLVESAVYTTVYSFVLFSSFNTELNVAAKVVGIEDRFDDLKAVPGESGDRRHRRLTVMTDRERQIMSLVSEGLSNKEIGRRLNIADGTIKVHLHHIFQKLEISNRTLLAALVISNNGGAAVLPGNPALRVRLGELIVKE